MALVSWVVLGSSSLGPLTVVSGRLAVAFSRFVGALAWLRRIRRVVMARIRAMALMELIGPPAMAPRDGL